MSEVFWLTVCRPNTLMCKYMFHINSKGTRLTPGLLVDSRAGICSLILFWKIDRLSRIPEISQESIPDGFLCERRTLLINISIFKISTFSSKKRVHHWYFPENFNFQDRYTSEHLWTTSVGCKVWIIWFLNQVVFKVQFLLTFKNLLANYYRIIDTAWSVQIRRYFWSVFSRIRTE